MMKLFKNEDAFTGLEAAIVLIAFVVVAAVFSYVMLGAGFFATQEAQQVVHTGSQQASSSLEIIGNVYGYNVSGSNTELDYLVFTVGNTAGGTPIDITQMLVTYVCGEVSEVIMYNTSASIVNSSVDEVIDPGNVSANIDDSNWTVIQTYNDVGNVTNHLLESGEQFVLAVRLPEPKPTNNVRFAVNLHPAVGAVYPIER
ncbi:MAG: archaellin/type IV pilin N-terminal domain-containing protein, partial [Methanoculleus sp.]